MKNGVSNGPGGGINPNRTANVNPCEPGWEPIPIEDVTPSYNPTLYDTIGISDALQNVYPCTFAFINDSLPNANYLAQVAGAMVFKDSAYMHLTFDTSTIYTQRLQAAAHTDNGSVLVDSDGFTHFHAIIKFNGWYLRNSTKEYMVSTIIHEVMHAIISLRWGQYQKWLQFGPPNDIDSNFIKLHYPIYWYTYTNQSIPINQIDHHQIMATDYFNLQKNIVGQFWNPQSPPALKDSVLKALSYGGLHETTAWKLLGENGIDTCRYNAIDIAAGESKTNGFILSGCGTYYINYTDSLKLRAGCN